MKIRLSCLLFTICFRLLGQTTQADFIIPSTVCLNERFKPANLSTNSLEYRWDFCGDDLSKQPSAKIVVNSYGGYGTRLEMAESNNEIFGFFISGGSKKLFRLNFGTDINAQPTTTDLGDLKLNSNQLRAIDIVDDEGFYYGFIVDSEKNKVYRIDFGNSLKNAPSDPIEIYAGSALNAPYQIASVKDGSLKYLFISNSGDGKLVRLKFNVSFANAIIEAYSLSISTNWLNSISFLKADDIWYCATVSPLTGEVLKLTFVNGLNDNSPVVTSIAIATPMSVEFANENGVYYLFAQSRNPTQSIFRLSFGASLSNLPQSISEIYNIGYGSLELWNFSIFNYKSRWVGFGTESVGSNIYQVEFPNNCFSETEYSTEIEPEILVSESGTHIVSLTSRGLNGEYSYANKTITVSNLLSSDVSFVNQNICSNNDVNFMSTNTSGDIISYKWDFGDLSSSIEANPSHQYAGANQYEVNLIVTASNGCNNSVQKTLSIYDKPLSSFTLPSGQICTNNEFTFINTTSDQFDGNLFYEWLVDGVPSSTNRDLKYTFGVAGDKTIKLRVGIPGCIDESIQVISNIQEGPTSDFSVSGHCEAETVSFTNSSTGNISGYQWNFGDGHTTTGLNPFYTYSEKGIYLVTLNASGTNGCVGTSAKTITIYSTPKPNFSLDLPPFSCAGSSSQFNDLTTPLTDSNITSWSWSFGDAANGVSTQKNPNYTYSTAADYDVSLLVTSNFGCSNIIEKTITISPSPVAEFTADPSCLNKPTKFTDASGSDVKAWLWSINNSSYNAQHPTHTFSTTGTQTVMLTVTGNNNCVSQTTKTVSVPVPVIVDFTSTSTCAGTTAVFHEINVGGVDPAVAWNWNFAGQANASTSPAQHVFPNTGNFPVTLTSTRQSGCSYSITKSIPISQPPTASFTVSTEAGASPLTVGFTNTSTLATSFLWKFNDPANSTSAEYSPAFVFNQLGSYVVELIASNAAGCSDNFMETIQVVVPEINAVLSDFVLSSTPDGGKKATVTIKNKSNITLVNPEVYIDLAGNALIREKLSGTILPGQSITRTLTADIIPRDLTYACAEVKVLGDSYQFDDRACLNLTTEPTYLQPYPNPAQSQLFLDWINENQESLQVVIYNSSGQMAMSRKYNLLPGLNQVLVDVNDLANGIYFVSYSDGRIIQSFRFSIAR
jgi:PKD repeat protein